MLTVIVARSTLGLLLGPAYPAVVHSGFGFNLPHLPLGI